MRRSLLSCAAILALTPLGSFALDFEIDGDEMYLEREIYTDELPDLAPDSFVASRGSAKSSEEHDLFLDLYAEIGISAEFYWFTLNAAPADDMHFMTDTKIERYGLMTAPIGTMP